MNTKEIIIEKVKKFELFDKDGFPYLIGIKNRGGKNIEQYSIKIWCKYCNIWHQHGMGAGHRIAHCNSFPIRQESTLYDEKGYFLIPLDLEEIEEFLDFFN